MNPVEVQGMTRTKTRIVKFGGNAKLKAGTAVCYSRSNGTATVNNPERDRRVELPNQSNQMWFAGIVCHDYEASSSDVEIIIAEPGSVLSVEVDAAVTAIGQIGAFIANHGAANANVGKFSAAYSNGRGMGSVEFIQTIAAPGPALAIVLQGTNVAGVEALTVTAAAPISAFGTSVLTRGASDLSTAQLAAGTFIGQRKTLRCIGAATQTVTVPLGSNGGKRRVTAIGSDQAIAGVAFSNIVFANSGTLFAVLEWNGSQWVLIDTNCLNAAFT